MGWIESRERASPRVEVATELKKEPRKHRSLAVLSFIVTPLNPVPFLAFVSLMLWFDDVREGRGTPCLPLQTGLFCALILMSPFFALPLARMTSDSKCVSFSTKISPFQINEALVFHFSSSTPLHPKCDSSWSFRRPGSYFSKVTLSC